MTFSLNITRSDDAASMSTLSWTTRSLMIIPLLVIACFSVVGNSFLLRWIWIDTRMHTTTNKVIFSQSIADLGTTIFVIPFTVVTVLKDEWVFGDTFCIINSGFNIFLTVITISNVTTIAVNRYLAIIKVTSQSSQRKYTVLSLTTAWGFSLIYGLPWLIFIKSQVRVTFFFGFYVCGYEYIYPLGSLVSTFIVSQVVLFAFLPIIVVVFSFYNIFRTVKKNRKRVSPTLSSNAFKLANEIYSRSAYTSLFLIGTSLLMVFPACTLTLLRGLQWVVIPDTLATILKWIMFCHCAVKPIIYISRNDRWVREIRLFLYSRCFVRKPDTKRNILAYRRKSRYSGTGKKYQSNIFPRVVPFTSQGSLHRNQEIPLGHTKDWGTKVSVKRQKSFVDILELCIDDLEQDSLTAERMIEAE